MRTITITKKNAEFIKETASKEINTGKNFQRAFYLPVFYRLVDVAINSAFVVGTINGEFVQYDVIFTEEAQEILDIY